MSKNILYLKCDDIGCQEIVSEFARNGYHIVECDLEQRGEIEQQLGKKFYYFALSKEFHEEIYKACISSATKYVTCIGQVQPELINYYTLLQPRAIFNEREEEIYVAINELYQFHQEKAESVKSLKDLNTVEDEEELCRLTEQYFAGMESERELSFRLKELLMEYINGLLALQTEDGWREIVLWNKRHECRRLCNRFWQFYLLQKVTAIFSEEMLQYYENGEIPSIVQFRSFEELSESYFHLLLLVRRLNYDVSTEEKTDIVRYIMEKKISGIFIRHVIEQNQIEDKEKVYKHLEELLIKYEQ